MIMYGSLIYSPNQEWEPYGNNLLYYYYHYYYYLKILGGKYILFLNYSNSLL